MPGRSDADSRDALARLLDLAVEPGQRLYRMYRLVDWSSVPDEEAVLADHIKALFATPVEGHKPSDIVWDWSNLHDQWRPENWDPALVMRTVYIAEKVGHPLVRAFLLEAVIRSKAAELDRRSIARATADAHLEWARTMVAEQEISYPCWVHFYRGRSLLFQFGYQEDALTVEEEVLEHATRLLQAGDNNGVRATGAIAAFTETRHGAMVDDESIMTLLDLVLDFANTNPVHLWSMNALDVADRLAPKVGRDRGALASRRVHLLLREADKREREEAPAMVVQNLVQGALKVVIDWGLGKELVDTLNQRLRELGERVVDQMEERSFTIELDDNGLQQVAAFKKAVTSLSNADGEEALRWAAFNCAPALDPVKAVLKEQGPSFMDVLSGGYMTGDRIGGAITRERRGVQMYIQMYTGYYLRLMNMAVGLVEEEHGAQVIAAAIAGGRCATGRSDVALLHGIEAFAAERHTQAVYTLLPELEAHVRGMVRLLGRPRTAYVKDRQREHTLDTLIETMKDTITVEDHYRVTDFLQCLLSHEDGFNLRNHALHGLLDPGGVGRAEALMVIHGLLLLAGLDVVEAPPSSDLKSPED